MSMEWPEWKICQLRQLWDEGHSTAEIGRRLFVTKNAVVGKAHRLDLPARPSPIRPPGEPRPRAPRVPRVHKDSLPLLSCLRGSAPPPEPRKPYVPRIRHPEAPMSRPTAATSVLTGPVGPVCDCRWPIGEPKTKEFRFCEEPSVPGKSYCEDHVKLAYIKIERRAEAA